MKLTTGNKIKVIKPMPHAFGGTVPRNRVGKILDIASDGKYTLVMWRSPIHYIKGVNYPVRVIWHTTETLLEHTKVVA